MDIAKAYKEKIFACLDAIESTQGEALGKAAALLANAVAEDRLIHVIGPGGHSNMAAEEVFWRAGGLAPVNAMLDAGTNLIHGAKRSNYVERTPGYAKAVFDTYGLKQGDVLVIANAYGINSMTIDCALECKARGIASIAITSTSFANAVPKGSASRHPSGQNLYELADVFIDNHLPLGDAVVDVPGISQRMGPTSTFVNCFTINLLMMRTAQALLERDITPAVWMSANLPEGDRNNRAYEEKYMPRIKQL